MDDATCAMWISRARIGIGLTAVLAPRFATRLLSTDGEAGGVAPLLARMAGARDVALGLGTLVAVDKGAPVRGWLEGSAIADAADAFTAVLGRKQLAPRAFAGSLLLASSAALSCLALSRRLDTPPAPHPGQPEAVLTGHHD